MIKEIKITFLGNSGVGKSSIVKRYCFEEFDEHNQSNLGADYVPKEMEYQNNKIKLQIWDTAGQEKFRSLVPLFLRTVIIVYDITQKSSFTQLKEWVSSLEQICSKNQLFFLVGNKCDLIEQEQVTYDEAKQYSYNLKAPLQYTSCKNNEGIQELFQKIVEEYLKQEEELKNKELLINEKQNSKLKVEKKNYSTCC
uniref:Rab_C43 protein n=1 Tax=Paramecium tetraurelia TaxID=5888 RepID=Q3SD68_PARTE|nr:rab_C43 [Paramecium tetraurelia]